MLAQKFFCACNASELVRSGATQVKTWPFNNSFHDELYFESLNTCLMTICGSYGGKHLKCKSSGIYQHLYFNTLLFHLTAKDLTKYQKCIYRLQAE